MKIQQLRKTDQFIINSLLAMLPLLLLPFLLSHHLKVAAPKDFLWVLIFSLIIVLNQQAEDFWHWPHLLINGLLAIPVIFLFIEKSYLIALLLLMQFIIKIAISPTTMNDLDLRLGLLLEQGIVPIFLVTALLAAVSEQISAPQIWLVSAIFLSRVAFTIPFHQFLDFLWPLLALILLIVLWSLKIIALPALIVSLIILLASLAFYPQRKNISQFPDLLLLALVLVNTLL